jgi:hypothetical protein
MYIIIAIIYSILMFLYYIKIYEPFTEQIENCKYINVNIGQDTDCGQGYYMQASSVKDNTQIVKCCNVPKPVVSIFNKKMS